MNRRISELTRSRCASQNVMGSCDLVEQHRPHLGEQVHDHGRRFRARSGLLCLRSNLLCRACSLAHDTAGSGKISIAKMMEHREVSRLIPRSKTKRSIVKLVAAM